METITKPSGKEVISSSIRQLTGTSKVATIEDAHQQFKSVLGLDYPLDSINLVSQTHKEINNERRYSFEVNLNNGDEYGKIRAHYTYLDATENCCLSYTNKKYGINEALISQLSDIGKHIRQRANDSSSGWIMSISTGIVAIVAFILLATGVDSIGKFVVATIIEVLIVAIFIGAVIDLKRSKKAKSFYEEFSKNSDLNQTDS